MRQRLAPGGVPELRAPYDGRRGQVALVDPTLGCDATFGSVGNDVVLIVALTPIRRLLFVQTPAGLELPAGFVDAGEPLLSATARELYAETGYEGTAVRVVDLPPRTLRTAGGGAFRVCLVMAARPDREAPRARLLARRGACGMSRSPMCMRRRSWPPGACRGRARPST